MKNRASKNRPLIGTRATQKGIKTLLTNEKKKRKYKNQNLELYVAKIPNSKTWRKDERGKFGVFAKPKNRTVEIAKLKAQQKAFALNQRKREIKQIKTNLRMDGVFIGLNEVIPDRYMKNKMYNPSGLKLTSTDKTRIKNEGYNKGI